MQSILMRIVPEREWTRVIAMAGPMAERTVLKARLSPLPSSRSALPALLEAIALWQGRPVHAVLVAGSEGAAFGTSLYRGYLRDSHNALYTLEYAEFPLRPRRRDDISGMGSFEDLRQMMLFRVAP